MPHFTSQHSTLGMRNFENNVGKVEMMVSGIQQFRYIWFCQDYLSILDYFNLDKWECPWARHFRAQPSTGETQENMNNVNCRCDMTEILLKVA